MPTGDGRGGLEQQQVEAEGGSVMERSPAARLSAAPRVLLCDTNQNYSFIGHDEINLCWCQDRAGPPDTPLSV